MKVTLFIVALIVTLFVVTANYSEVETYYECVGDLRTDVERKPKTVYARFSKYRWWVNLWSDSNGSLWIEVPAGLWIEVRGGFVYDFEKIKDNDITLMIFKEEKWVGSFSTISNIITVELDEYYFEGACTVKLHPKVTQ